jgi:hypothetical protein
MEAETGRARFIRLLEDAADNIGDMPRHELAVLLRRAAIRLRNVETAQMDATWRALIDDMNEDDGA